MPRATLMLPSGRGLGARSTGALPCWSPPDYGLYLGSAGEERRSWGLTTISWPHRWLVWSPARRPDDDTVTVSAIVDLVERSARGERVEVACRSGVARTGTVVACVAVLDGMTAKEAIRWTRASYHPGAGTIPWLRRWVSMFAESR